jgi:hypothetical protein
MFLARPWGSIQGFEASRPFQGIVVAGEFVEMVQLRWGFPPARPKGAPVINFRSEGRHRLPRYRLRQATLRLQCPLDRIDGARELDQDGITSGFVKASPAFEKSRLNHIRAQCSPGAVRRDIVPLDEPRPSHDVCERYSGKAPRDGRDWTHPMDGQELCDFEASRPFQGIVVAGEFVEMVQLRWGFPPARPKGAPVINFRSEGRHRLPRYRRQ